MLHLLAALSLGACAGFMLCASGVGLTARDVVQATADSAARTWARISSKPRLTPGQAVEAALARMAAAPVDHPLAPTLDELADDDAADPICAAAREGRVLVQPGGAPYSLRTIVQHLQLHGRSRRDALDQAAALAGIRPVALERILAGTYQRTTTDAELDNPFDRIPPMPGEFDALPALLGLEG